MAYIGKFLFKAPSSRKDLTSQANTTLLMAAMASRMIAEQRTRTYHPDGRLENVAEHSFMLAKVAAELAEELYPNLDANLVARLSLLHDDVEAYVGDTPTDFITKEQIAAKIEREEAGTNQLVKEYASIGGYAKLVKLYEEQELAEARFVRLVDKLMVLLIHPIYWMKFSGWKEKLVTVFPFH